MLNIKRQETYELAKTLAERTGLSLTDAVTLALKEKLETLDAARERQFQEKMAKVREIQSRFAAIPGQPFSSADIDDILYDEEGLPK